ncbi:hypothetical protein SAY86_001349 [Trapa natans]|uniref:Uncharacterized protein n=1 Tax=Trapa natans TaxID=22666 RepID=A0AAN7RMB5_TRANT|nr:hypothetical protein SAY86_001349 [Trapa natans]
MDSVGGFPRGDKNGEEVDSVKQQLNKLQMCKMELQAQVKRGLMGTSLDYKLDDLWCQFLPMFVQLTLLRERVLRVVIEMRFLQ